MNRLTATILVSFALILGVLVGQGRFPPPATAYPAGAAVSYGANPVVATGGSVAAGSSATLFTAPAGQDIVVTDLVLTASYNGGFSPCYFAYFYVTATTGSGDLAAVHLNLIDPVYLSFASGLPIAAGETLTLTNSIIGSGSAASNGTAACDPSYFNIVYTATGYYAEP